MKFSKLKLLVINCIDQLEEIDVALSFINFFLLLPIWSVYNLEEFWSILILIDTDFYHLTTPGYELPQRDLLASGGIDEEKPIHRLKIPMNR